MVKFENISYNDDPQHSVEITIDKNEIDKELQRRHCGVDLARIKIWDQEKNRYCWFVITASLSKGNRPLVEVTAIAEKQDIIKKCIGTWRKGKEDNG